MELCHQFQRREREGGGWREEYVCGRCAASSYLVTEFGIAPTGGNLYPKATSTVRAAVE